MDSYQKQLNYVFGYETGMENPEYKPDCTGQSLLQRGYLVPSNVYSPSMTANQVYRRTNFPQCGNSYFVVDVTCCCCCFICCFAMLYNLKTVLNKSCFLSFSF